MKVTLITFILTVMLNASAADNDCVSCTDDLKPFDGVIKNLQTLQTSIEVNCVDQLKTNARDEYLANFAHLSKKKSTIKGLNLEGSAEEIKILKKMLSDKPTAKWPKTTECKTVLCALTFIYNSEESAHRALNIAARDGYIISAAKDFPITNNEYIGQLFSLEELQKIDLAHKMLPPMYKKLKSLDRIKRLPDGYSSSSGSSNTAAYASPAFRSSYYNEEGEITFLKAGFTGEHSWGPMVTVHELAHHVDFSKSDKVQFGISESPEFLKLSGWKKSTKYETDKSGKKTAVPQWVHTKDKKFISNYAGTQPCEDFAEAAAHYMYFPRKFKTIDPEKYDFIKKHVFTGKEYLADPEMGIAKNDILNICIENYKHFGLFGNVILSSPHIPQTCLDRYMADFKYTDPKLCQFNTTQIKNYFLDQIGPLIESTNVILKECDQKLAELNTQCLDEGNFQKKCSLEKCNLQSPLKEKFRVSLKGDMSTKTMDAIQKKMGKQNYLTTVLINGLSEKNKVSKNSPLNRQQDFLNNAIKAMTDKFEKENFKFDSPKEASQIIKDHLMIDKDVSAALTSFQSIVLKNATRSKEKNLVLVKTWATSQSLDDTPMYDELAETLSKYGSFLH